MGGEIVGAPVIGTPTRKDPPIYVNSQMALQRLCGDPWLFNKMRDMAPMSYASCAPSGVHRQG